MKFLLTSAGLTNKTLVTALHTLVGKQPAEISVAFVPTAANPIEGDKQWLIDNLPQFSAQGYKSIDIVDIAAVSKESWQRRFEAADVICFGGGNEQYLAKILGESGVAEYLPGLLSSRVYMGISAGSMVAGHFLDDEAMKMLMPEEIFEEKADPLGLAPCYFIPHMNSDHFIHVRESILKKVQRDASYPLYACDDQSALMIDGDSIHLIGEGQTFSS
jgi:dipeptidase E